MRQVGCEFECEQGVVKQQVLPDILTDGCIGRQLKQAAVVVRQFELAGRAKHALAFHTAQLADLD